MTAKLLFYVLLVEISLALKVTLNQAKQITVLGISADS